MLIESNRCHTTNCHDRLPPEQQILSMIRRVAFVVPINDTSALADAMIRLATESPLRQRFSRAAQMQGERWRMPDLRGSARDCLQKLALRDRCSHAKPLATILRRRIVVEAQVPQSVAVPPTSAQERLESSRRGGRCVAWDRYPAR